MNDCVTVSYFAEASGVGVRKAYSMLLSAWRRGEYDRYRFTYLDVFCRPGAELVVPLHNGRGWVYVPPAKIYEKFVEILRGYRSRRAAVKTKTICEELGADPRVCSSVAADILHAAGVQIAKCTGDLCAIVDDVQEFLSNGGSPPALVPVEPRRRHQNTRKQQRRSPNTCRRRYYLPHMEMISFHLPRMWIEEIDRLVAQGRYETRAEFVREAIRQLLKKYDHLRA
jgi:Predicted transcriptional regulators containing the CopG/Arc/MetJ DNA-binding domain